MSEERRKVFVLDDDLHICSLFSDVLREGGFSVESALSLQEGLDKLKHFLPSVILLDLKLPDGDGLDYVGRFKSLSSQPEIIILTGVGTKLGARLAIEQGVWDFLTKPVDLDDFELKVRQAYHLWEAKLNARSCPTILRGGIIGESRALVDCLQQMASVAGVSSTVLITGETGVGKTVFARTVHDNSPRHAGPFVVVDCTTLNPGLIDAELFGHVKGTFTGAARDKQGLVEQADGGTLFLDEIGELPLETQKNLLRVIEETKFRAVGGTTDQKVDIRVIAATNRDLEAMVAEGQFRGDLLYRLKTIRLRIPSLRERKEDIPLLANHLLQAAAEKNSLDMPPLSDDFIRSLMRHDWPGNVRELANAMESALLQARGCDLILRQHLDTQIRAAIAASEVEVAEEAAEIPATPEESLQALVHGGDGRPVQFKDYRKAAIDLAEKVYMEQVVRLAGRDMKKVMELSGLSQARAYELVGKFGLR